jgi:hypothetical protein
MEKCMVDQRTAAKRIMEKCMAEQRTAEQRTAEQRTAEQHRMAAQHRTVATSTTNNL